MKLLIASDIHGSAAAMRMLDAHIAAEKPDRIVLLGDLLYHGPRNPLPEDYAPAEVAKLLNAHAESILAVRGNCDAEVDQMMLSFPCMAESAIIYDGARMILCSHGHRPGLGPDDLGPLPSGSLFLYGHFHVKRDETVNGVRFINPGSTSLPKDDSASFALYEDGAIRFVLL